MTRTGHTSLLAVLVALAAGCQSPETPERFEVEYSQPYQIYLYVDVEETAGEEEGAPETPILVDPLSVERIEKEIVAVANDLKLCTGIISRSAIEQSLGKSFEEARAKGADLVLRVQCREPEYSFSHRNAWFLPNTILWFVLGFPSFWVKDQVYEVSWSIRYDLRSVNEQPLPTPEEFISVKKDVPLNVTEREFSVEALYTPPGFFVGSKVGQALRDDAEDLLVRAVVDALKRNALKKDTLDRGRLQLPRSWGGAEIEILSPANHSTVRTGETDVAVTLTIEKGSTLQKLRLELDDDLLAERDVFSMSSLVKERELPDGRLQYEWRQPLAKILRGRERDRPSKFTDWNATRTIRFTTEEGPHDFRVLAFTRPVANSSVSLGTPAP